MPPLEQRFCKPLVGGSILSPGTNKIRAFLHFECSALPRKVTWAEYGQTDEKRMGSTRKLSSAVWKQTTPPPKRPILAEVRRRDGSESTLAVVECSSGEWRVAEPPGAMSALVILRWTDIPPLQRIRRVKRKPSRSLRRRPKKQ